MTHKELMKAIGLNRNWEFLFCTHDEVVARHKPTGKTWGFRY